MTLSARWQGGLKIGKVQRAYLRQDRRAEVVHAAHHVRVEAAHEFELAAAGAWLHEGDAVGDAVFDRCAATSKKLVSEGRICGLWAT